MQLGRESGHAADPRRRRAILHHCQYFSEIDLTFLGETHRTSWGSLLILEPNIPHSYTCREELLHHWFHLDGDVAGLLERYGLPPNQLHSLQNAEEISAILQQISMTYHDKGCFARTIWS